MGAAYSPAAPFSSFGLTNCTSFPSRKATSFQSSMGKSITAMLPVGRLSATAFLPAASPAANQAERHFMQAGIVADQHQLLWIFHGGAADHRQQFGEAGAIEFIEAGDYRFRRRHRRGHEAPGLLRAYRRGDADQIGQGRISAEPGAHESRIQPAAVIQPAIEILAARRVRFSLGVTQQQ